jgi:uncharacterized protein (DUF1697 family)
MQKYVAFLRAINVGGHTLKMGHLRRLFEELGYKNVETFIASGNVIFDSPSKSVKALEKTIENHLQSELGYRVDTFIRSIAELAKVAAHKPFSESELNKDGHILYIVFVGTSPPNEMQKKLISCATPVDDFHCYGPEVYWLCRKKFSESEFSGARLEKVLGMPATIRNVNTVRRIVSKYS